MDTCVKFPEKANLSTWAPVAHAYNPSYSRGRDQENLGLSPVCK
jgi:hypothetical protein